MKLRGGRGGLGEGEGGETLDEGGGLDEEGVGEGEGEGDIDEGLGG